MGESDDVENFGIVDDRDDLARLITYLDSHPVQVLLGIHHQALPDRGTLRKLDQIAIHAKHGLIVQLLRQSVDNSKEAPERITQQQTRHQQWQTALAVRKIGLVDID